ncbi:MAG: GNAT family N-acetyltransferase [Streptococcaceae bacterium]|jgi:GNAT superfamily N-acetyltransferase|nr:GNAT family N-acetyltransferase [Streptococcaceae bacterium]
MIRKAELQDFNDLVRLAKILGYPVRDLLEFKKRLAELLVSAGHLLFVAEIDGAVHGYIEADRYSSLCTEPVYRVLGLVVDSEFQDQGLGGELIKVFELEVLRLGVHKVVLTSGESRHLAHDFYEKHGYVMDHMQKKFGKEL